MFYCQLKSLQAPFFHFEGFQTADKWANQKRVLTNKILPVEFSMTTPSIVFKFSNSFHISWPTTNEIRSCIGMGCGIFINEIEKNSGIELRINQNYWKFGPGRHGCLRTEFYRSMDTWLGYKIEKLTRWMDNRPHRTISKWTYPSSVRGFQN